MSRATLLLSDTARDEAILETDIMRFMAIIGIVLWIIFALVKSLPFRQEALEPMADTPRIEALALETAPVPAPRPAPADSPPAPPAVERPAPPRPQFPARPVQAAPVPEVSRTVTEPPAPSPAPAPSRPVQRETAPAMAAPVREQVPEPGLAVDEPEPVASEQVMPEPERSEPERRERGSPSLDRSVDQFVAAAPQGVWIEFASREELAALLARGQVRIFAQARTTGFDLVYEAQAGGGTLRFKSAQDLPESLWVISGGQDREYFIGLLSRNEPSLAAFPDQDILVAFTDQTLEKRLLDQFDFLMSSGRSGILTITRTGDFVFKDHAPSQQTAQHQETLP